MSTRTVGRNAPCPCGSGLQYKRCCREKDRAEQSARDRARAAEQQEAVRECQVLDAASNAVVDLVEAGKLEEAEQAARELLVGYPQVPDGHERLALVYEARGDRRQAAECYRQVVEFIRARAGEFDPRYEQYLLEKLEGLEAGAAS